MRTRLLPVLLAGSFVFSFPVLNNGLLAQSNELLNSSFEHGDTLAGVSGWHRVKGEQVSYIASKNSWVIDEQHAWHGERSLRSNGGEPLLISAEVWNVYQRNSEWVFSVALKAEREGTSVRLKVGEYPGGFRQSLVSEVFSVGTEWKRYEVVASGFRGVTRSIHGPLNFWIEPLHAESSVWVDAVQWAPKSESGSYVESVKPLQVPVQEFRFLRSMPLPSLAATSAVSGQGSLNFTVYNSSVQSLRHAPVRGGILFPKGQWDGSGNVRLVSGGEELVVQTEVLARWPNDGSVQSVALSFEDELPENGKEYEFSYGLDGTVPETGLVETKGRHEWVVSLENITVHLNRTKGNLWESIRDRQTGEELFGEAIVRGVDIHGHEYSSLHSRQISGEVEVDGPYYTSVVSRGILSDNEGHGLSMYIARLHFWKNTPGVHVEISLVNTMNHGNVVLRDVWWETSHPGVNENSIVSTSEERGRLGNDFSLLQYFEFGDKMTNIPGGDVRFPNGAWGRKIISSEKGVIDHKDRGDVWLVAQGQEDRGMFLFARHGWQRHPSMLGLKGDGSVRGYLWPADPVKGVYLARGMALTREFVLLDTASGVANDVSVLEGLVGRYAKPPLLMMDQEWFTKVDPLVPVGARDFENFPQLEALFESETLLGRFASEAVEDNHMYGLFDYGDKHSHHGDGWVNLESFLDQSLMVRGMRNAEPEIFRQGLISAEHYRDIDINQTEGYAYIHNAGHAIGGGSSERLPRQDRWSRATPGRFDHSWPQGVMLHYLLTGSRQSRDTLGRVGEHMLQSEIDAWGFIEMGRTLGRFLQNLADLYQITGDDRYRERFFAQIAHSEVLLEGNKEHPTAGFFQVFPRPSWSPALEVPPFFAWYGLIGMARMYHYAEEDFLVSHIERELNSSVYQQRFIDRGKILWPNASDDEALAIIMGDYLGNYGRNYTLFSVLKMIEEYGIRDGFSGSYDRIRDVALDSMFLSLVQGKMNNLRQNSALARNQGAILASAALTGFGRDINEADMVTQMQELLMRAASDRLTTPAELVEGMFRGVEVSSSDGNDSLSFTMNVTGRNAFLDLPFVKLHQGKTVLEGSVAMEKGNPDFSLLLTPLLLPEGEFGQRREPVLGLRFGWNAGTIEEIRNLSDLKVIEKELSYDARSAFWTFRIVVEAEKKGVLSIRLQPRLAEDEGESIMSFRNMRVIPQEGEGL